MLLHRPKAALPGAALLLVTSMVLSACGDSLTESKGSDATPAGVTDTEILVGTTGPKTGPAGVIGQGTSAGLQIAIDEINADGGINGRQLRLTTLDDAFDPARIVANVRRLVSQDKVYALVAPGGTTALPGTWDYLGRTGTVVWGPITPPDPDLPNVFLVGPDRIAQLRVQMDYLSDQGANKVALIGQSNDVGAQGEEAIKQQLSVHGEMSLVSTALVDPAATDLSSAVNKVADTKPDAVILALSTAQIGVAVKQLRARGVKVPIATDQLGGVGSDIVVGPAGDAANGVLSTYTVDILADSPEVDAWRTAAQKIGGPAASSFSLQGFSYMKSFAEVLRRMDDDLSYDNFQKQAEGLADDPYEIGTMAPIDCGPLPGGHSCATAAGIAEFENGSWTSVQDITTPK